MKTINLISAGGIVIRKIRNSKSEIRNYILLCQHAKHKGWVFPKGIVGDTDPNEQKETAALREVEEEGGVKAKIIHPSPIEVHYTYEFNNALINKTVFYFVMEFVSGDPKNHDYEMMDAKFVAQDQVETTLTYASDKEALHQALQLL